MLENVSGHKLNFLTSFWEAFLKPQKKSFNPIFFLIVFPLDSLSQEYESSFKKSCFLFKVWPVQKASEGRQQVEAEIEIIGDFFDAMGLRYSFIFKLYIDAYRREWFVVLLFAAF